MARVIKVKLLGIEGIEARLKQMSDQAAGAALQSAVQATAEALRDVEIKRSPVASGRLRSAYEITTISKSRSRVVLALSMNKEAFYWRFLELGTKFIKGKDWIRKVYKPKRAWLRNIARDTFRDRMMGFFD